MNFYKNATIALTIFSLAAGTYAVSSAHPQQDQTTVGGVPRSVSSGFGARTIPAAPSPGVPAALGRTTQDSFFGGKPSPFAQAKKTLRDSDSTEEKQKAKDTIREELDKQYDAFLERNEKQLENMEKRLAKLRDQLERRKAAKRRMIDLELERMVNEADGLVWPGNRGTLYGGARVSGTGSDPFDSFVAPASPLARFPFPSAPPQATRPVAKPSNFSKSD